MNVSFYGHTRQYHNIKSEIDANIEESSRAASTSWGPMLKQFEAELAAYTGTKYAIGVGNGTDAIWLALMALGIGPGDEVITHPNTFFATAEAIWIAGATAVFVDCDRDDQCIDPKADRGGHHPEDQGHHPRPPLRPVRRHAAISKIADKHKLVRIEDNAQAIGARGDDFKIGELSDAATTSFIIQKNLGTFGDGGALVTNNAESTPRSASCATTARPRATSTASASTAAWTTSTPASSAPS